MRRGVSIAKLGETVNEDAIIARERLIAVADGAGGGGVFADLWADCLSKNLPDEPFADFAQLDAWVDSIWEPFYNEREAEAKLGGGMLLNKFYDEGSFSTLVAVWRIDENHCRWISYGDSVAFCYSPSTGRLRHSFGALSDFNNPAYLIGCTEPLDKAGFKSGDFLLQGDEKVFVASDALSHYILMMYLLAHRADHEQEINDAILAGSRNSNYIQVAAGMGPIDFDKVLVKLTNCINNPQNFLRHLSSLNRKGLIAYDDYSLAMFL